MTILCKWNNKKAVPEVKTLPSRKLDISPPTLFPAGEGKLEKTIRIPKGYQATVFGRAPKVNYPTFIKAAADGVLFVSVDKNGTLDRESKRGKILQLVDTNGDGIIQVNEVQRMIDGFFIGQHDRGVMYVHSLIDFFFEQP